MKELLKIDDVFEGLNIINLKGVEQFTLTIVDWNDSLELIEFVWDGTKKHQKIMKQEPQIWSSATLYDREVKKLRKDWFEDWQKENDFTQENILKFHHTAGVGDKQIDVMMDRKVGGTVSVTSIQRKNKELHFIYEDVLTRKVTVI